MPTCRPGWWCVPRWRIRISPALTFWPPKRLTPRRWAFESRPFRLEDAPFLCAMSVRSSNLVGRNSGDLDLGERLTVTHPTLVPGLVPVVHDVDLGALDRAEDLSGDRELRELVNGADDVGAIDDQHGGEVHHIADLGVDPVDG